MWLQLGTLAIGVLTVAVSANWLIGRRSRRLHRLRAEVELLAALPDDAGGEELRRHVRGEVARYVAEAQEIAALRRRRKWTIAVYAAVVWLAAAVACAGLLLLSGEVLVSTRVAAWMVLGSMVVVGIAVGVFLLVDGRVSRRVAELVDADGKLVGDTPGASAG